MSDYTSNFENSEFHTAWQSISEKIAEINTEGYEATYINNFARFKKVYAFIDGILANIDPDYLPMQEVLNQLPQSAAHCLSQLQAAQAGDQNHLNHANRHLDEILNAIKPYTLYDKKIKATLRAAINAYIGEINTHLKSIADTKTIYDEAETYKDSIEEYRNELFEGDEETLSIKSEISELRDNANTQTDEIEEFHTRLFENDDGKDAIEAAILAAKESAEENSTEIEQTLADIQSEVKELKQFYTTTFGSKDDDGARDGGLDKELTQMFKTLERYEEEQISKHDALFEKIESLLPGATTTGLAKSYEERKKGYKGPIWSWNLVFFACVMGISVFALYNMQEITDWENTLKRIIHYAPIYAPVIWLAIYATKRRSESRALAEEYAHKEALAKSYSSYKTQIEAIGQDNSELMAKLLSKTIDTISENPSAVLNGKHGDEPPMATAFEIAKEMVKLRK